MTLAALLAMAASAALTVAPAQAAPTTTWDNPHSYSPSTARYEKYYSGAVLSRDGSTAFRYWTSGNYGTFNVAVTDLSGATPDYGPVTQPAPLAFGSDYADASMAALSSDGSTVVVAQMVQLAAGANDYIWRIAAGQISGTTITWGSSVTVAQASYDSPGMAFALDGTGTKGVFMTMTRTSNVSARPLKAREFSVSGNTITEGQVTELDSDIGPNGEADVALTPDGSKAIARWSVEGSPWRMKAAKATRNGNGNLDWTSLDNLTVPNGYSWNNNSDNSTSQQLAISDDGSRAGVAIAAISGQSWRAGLWGLNPSAASGSQWTDVSWIAPDPGLINQKNWVVDISADGSALAATANGTNTAAYVRTRKYDGTALSAGSQLDLAAPASEWTSEAFPWLAMDAAGTTALIAFTDPTTQGINLPLDLDPTTAAVTQDDSQIQAISTPSQSEFQALVADDYSTQVVSWAIGVSGTPYIRTGTSFEPPVFTDETPGTTGTVDSPYEAYTFVATGRPTPTYEVATGSLPPGLALDKTTGKLTGTPTTAGTYTFTVRATNTAGTDETASITITIAAAPVPGNLPVFVDKTPPTTGATGSKYAGYTFVATGEPAPTYKVASGSLPPGLTLDETTGELTGTPTKAGTYTFTVRATNSAGSVETETITITISAPSDRRAPQKPAKPLGLPTSLAPTGWTRLVKLPVVTNAGRKAAVRARCRQSATSQTAGEVRYCRFQRTNQALKVWLAGNETTVVRVVMHAPGTTKYRPFRKVVIYRTRAAR